MNSAFSYSAYSVLGVSPAASGEEIEEAFRDLEQKLDPVGLPFSDVREAFFLLRDEAARIEYDRVMLNMMKMPMLAENITVDFGYSNASLDKYTFVCGFLEGAWHAHNKIFAFSMGKYIPGRSNRGSFMVEITGDREMISGLSKQIAKQLHASGVECHPQVERMATSDEAFE